MYSYVGTLVIEVDKTKFKNPSGAFYLRGLFFEEQGADKQFCVYTLKKEDHLGYPSLYKLYMESNDPTEYSFATVYLYNWDHWESLCECTWFKPHLAQWRRELNTKIRAEALLNIRVLAHPDKQTSFQANKYLLDGAWIGAGEAKRGKGRPGKAEIEKAASDLARASHEASEDYQRILGTKQ